MQFSLSVVAAFAALCAALPTTNIPHVLHEKRDAPTTTNWVKRGIVPSGNMLPVRIGLTQSNLEKGRAILDDISRHDSPNYGKHLSVEEVHDLFAPSKDTVEAVSAWLRNAGVEFSHSVNKQWMELDLNAEELGSLLRTKYDEWEHVGTGKLHVSCDE